MTPSRRRNASSTPQKQPAANVAFFFMMAHSRRTCDPCCLRVLDPYWSCSARSPPGQVPGGGGIRISRQATPGACPSGTALSHEPGIAPRPRCPCSCRCRPSRLSSGRGGSRRPTGLSPRAGQVPGPPSMTRRGAACVGFREAIMHILSWLIIGGIGLGGLGGRPPGTTGPAAPALADYFPPPEDQGGWRTLLPDARRARRQRRRRRIREVGGVDWDKLKAAWEHNAGRPARPGLLVIRKGYIVGEWYRDGDRTTAFNIYSSSKSYTSTAFGLILSDFGSGPLPGGKTLTLDTKVCNERMAPRVAAAARPAQGRDHRPAPAEHGLGPRRASPSREGAAVRVGARARRGLAVRQAQGRPGHGLPLQQRRRRPPGAASSTGRRARTSTRS